MSKCYCPVNLESLSQMCAFCEADYLNYLDEKQSTEPEDDGTRPATLAEMQEARLLAAEANLENHRMALRAIAARVDAISKQLESAA